MLKIYSLRKSFLLYLSLNRNSGSSLLFFLEGGEFIEIDEVAEAVIFRGDFNWDFATVVNSENGSISDSSYLLAFFSFFISSS